MLGKLEVEGFTATVLGYCKDNGALIYMRILAPPTADKAIWAVLNSSEARRGYTLSNMLLSWGGGRTSLSLESGIRYFCPRVQLPCGYTDMAFLHPDATTSAGDKTFYLVTGEDHDGPPPAFFPMLNTRLALPLLPDWAGWLWDGGIKGYLKPGDERKWNTPNLVKRLDAKGAAVYKVRADDQMLGLWLAVIRRGLGFDPMQWVEVEEEAA